MSFIEEKTWYGKTILSDLQGAWGVLRQAIVDNSGFNGWDRALFHTDEAMSWEVVRNLRQMPNHLIIIRNLCTQGNACAEIMESIESAHEILDETLKVYPN